MPDGSRIETACSPPTVSMTSTCEAELAKESHAQPEGSAALPEPGTVIARAWLAIQEAL